MSGYEMPCIIGPESARKTTPAANTTMQTSGPEGILTVVLFEELLIDCLLFYSRCYAQVRPMIPRGGCLGS
jgi:hypothetical protein